MINFYESSMNDIWSSLVSHSKAYFCWTLFEGCHNLSSPKIIYSFVLFLGIWYFDVELFYVGKYLAAVIYCKL